MRGDVDAVAVGEPHEGGHMGGFAVGDVGEGLDRAERGDHVAVGGLGVAFLADGALEDDGETVGGRRRRSRSRRPSGRWVRGAVVPHDGRQVARCPGSARRSWPRPIVAVWSRSAAGEPGPPTVSGCRGGAQCGSRRRAAGRRSPPRTSGSASGRSWRLLPPGVRGDLGRGVGGAGAFGPGIDVDGAIRLTAGSWSTVTR